MILQLFFTFLLSAGLTWLLANKIVGFNLIDHPNDRSLHTQPTPRSGGLAISISLAVFFFINLSVLSEQIINITIGATAILLVSVLDDIKHVPAPIRLLVHVLAASWIVHSGLVLKSIILPGGLELFLPELVSWILTVFIITWMTNLYNFMDGIDGLAGGMTVIGFGIFAITCFPHSNILFTISLFIIAGTLGFLIFNFPPAKIFMGDAGSSVLGFIAAVMMLSVNETEIMPLWLSLILFSPFIIDATVTLLIRAFNKEKIWAAHKQHYYQRLVESGRGHRKTVLFEYCLMIVCGALVLTGLYAEFLVQMLIVGVFVIMYIGIISFIHKKVKPVM